MPCENFINFGITLLSHQVSLTAEQHTFNSLFAIIGDGVFGNALEIGGVVAEEAREFGITFV